MDNLIYTAMNGAKNLMNAQALQMNNLANVNTIGFREDLQVFVSSPVQGEGFPTRVYSKAEDNAANFASGTMVTTGRPLDVAIQGAGWFVVQGPKGTEALTRAGVFELSPSGQLVTPEGYPVMGDGGPITIPQAESIAIGSDGVISIKPIGQQTGSAIVGQLKLVNPEGKDIGKGADGLFYRKADGTEFASDPKVKIAQGMLEHSNVNAVSSLIEIIALSREFELELKMMKEAGDIAQRTTQAMQVG